MTNAMTTDKPLREGYYVSEIDSVTISDNEAVVASHLVCGPDGPMAPRPLAPFKMHMTEPQSCYHDEIETLREMLNEQRVRLEEVADRPATSAMVWMRNVCEKRIDALTTAIKELGGAL
jgi:hypothetical protein